MKKALLITIASLMVSLYAFGDDRVLPIQNDDIIEADANLGKATRPADTTKNLEETVSAEAKKLKNKKSDRSKKRNRN